MQHESGRPAPKQEAGSEPDWRLMEDSFALLVLGLLVEGQGDGMNLWLGH